MKLKIETNMILAAIILPIAFGNLYGTEWGFITLGILFVFDHVIKKASGDI